MSQLLAQQIVKRFWLAMQSNDFTKASEWLSDDFVCDWVLSNERIIGRDNFIAINTAYPANGKWLFTINRIVSEADKVVTEVDVTDGAVTARVLTFHYLKQQKICKQVEYWVDEYEAPEWRKPWVVPIS